VSNHWAFLVKNVIRQHSMEQVFSLIFLRFGLVFFKKIFESAWSLHGLDFGFSCSLDVSVLLLDLDNIGF
jgi:hypothetical protein